jgi:hypothetical protein
MSHHLSLVDWRTRVADLYASVRAAPAPAEGHRRWVHGRTELFASHPQSPTARTAATVRYAPYDPRLRFQLPLLPAEPETRGVPAGDDGTLTMHRVGRVELPDPVTGSLDVWWLDQYGGGLFVPLRDGTSGTTSYGGGRYLVDTTKGAWLGSTSDALMIDLNFAYHPSCRYDDRWQCPLAPPGNTIEVPVEAGEQL